MANITSIADIVSIAQNAGGSTTIPYVSGSEALAYETAMTNNGFSVIEGGLTSKAVETVGSNGLNTLAGQAVEVALGTEQLEVVPIAQTTTAGGMALKAGGMAASVPTMSIVLGVIGGCGLGYELYRLNPEFWTSISNSLIGWKSISPNSDTEIPYLKFNSFSDAMIRIAEDNALKLFVKKDSILNVIDALYDNNALSGKADFKTDITHGGSQVLTSGGASIDMIQSINHMDASTYNSLSNYKTLIENNAGKEANAITILYRYNTVDNFVDLYAYFYSITDSERIVTINDGNITANVSQDCIGYITCRSRIDSGAWISSSYSYNSDAKATHIGGTIDIGASTYYVGSTVGGQYIPPAPETYPNPDETQINTPLEMPTAFPLWVGNGFSTTQYNPTTNTNDLIDWLPLSIPSSFEETSPSYKPNQEAVHNGVIPENVIDPTKIPDFLKDIIDRGADGIPPENDYPEIPTGSTPVVVAPTGLVTGSSKLYTVYKPTDTELNNLGAYLWSSNVIQRLIELFTNNPMDAIISLHQLYALPTVGDYANIVLGDIVTTVSSARVTNQYTKINCGSIKILEKYNDARDYDFTTVQIYLPFIGFRELDVHDVVNCTVTVEYSIDVYTGTCLAEIICTKNNLTQTLYTFDGNCSVQIPLTASDRTRMLTAFARTVGGYAIGGLGGAMVSALSGGAQAPIEKSGGFSGNVGAMACKKPYLVITRNKSAYAEIQPQIEGRPTNRSVYLKDCKGYVRVKGIHLDSLKCTDKEKDMLMTILKNGIIL